MIDARRSARGARQRWISLGPGPGFSITAERRKEVPESLAGLVDTVVQVPPLRQRPGDILVLARHAARQARGRDVDFTATAERALQSCGWRDNIDQLIQVIRLGRDAHERHRRPPTPPEVLNGSHRRLARLEAFERDEIVRLLTEPVAPLRPPPPSSA